MALDSSVMSSPATVSYTHLDVYKRQAQYPSVVIGVEDIKTAIKKVAQAGGEVLGEPYEIPGIGHYVSFMDSEGNRVSMLQPMRHSV